MSEISGWLHFIDAELLTIINTETKSSQMKECMDSHSSGREGSIDGNLESYAQVEIKEGR